MHRVDRILLGTVVYHIETSPSEKHQVELALYDEEGLVYRVFEDIWHRLSGNPFTVPLVSPDDLVGNIDVVL
jgi:hypothetical protein